MNTFLEQAMKIVGNKDASMDDLRDLAIGALVRKNAKSHRRVPKHITGQYSIDNLTELEPYWVGSPLQRGFCNLNSARMQLRFPDYKICGGHILVGGANLYGVDKTKADVNYMPESDCPVELLGHVWIQHPNGNVIDCFWEDYNPLAYEKVEKPITAAPKLIKKRRSPVSIIKVPIHKGLCFKMTPKAQKRMQIEYVECLTPRAEKWLHEFVKAAQAAINGE